MKNGKYTNDELKVIIHCRRDEQTVRLATDLLETRENNLGVWDGAPENAILCRVLYSSEYGNGWNIDAGKTYHRELPKTKAREIAEKTFADLNKVYSVGYDQVEIDIIESAINEALKDN